METNKDDKKQEELKKEIEKKPDRTEMEEVEDEFHSQDMEEADEEYLVEW